MMDGRLPLVLVIFQFITLALGDAGKGFEFSMMVHGKLQHPNCDSCLEASRRAEKALNEPELFEEIEILSSEVCRILPSELKIKCLEKSGAYIYQTKFSLKHLFHEASLCNSTKLCTYETTHLPTLVSFISGSPEMDEGVCSDCRKGIKNIFEGIKTPRLRKKIMEALIDYCEEEGENEKQCKQTVSKFAPRFLSGIEKLKPTELCRMIGLCDEGINSL